MQLGKRPPSTLTRHPKILTIIPRLKNALVQEPVLERVLKTTLHTNRFPNHSEICPYWDISGLHKQIHVTPTKPRPGESLVAGFRYSCLSVRSTGLVSKGKHILILVRDVAHGLSFPFRSQSCSIGMVQPRAHESFAATA